MPKGIGQRSIGGRVGIGRRAIGARYGLVNAQEPYNFGSGGSGATKTYSFSPPKSGYWKFVAWACGAGATSTDATGGGSGSYAEKTVYLKPSQAVAITVGNVPLVGVNPSSTTITFPDGSVVTCTAGQNGASGGAGGLATGGDVNLNGTAAGANASGLGTGGGAGGISTTGAGAPANLPYRGGDGGVSGQAGGFPGAGGGCGSSSVTGGGSQVLAVFIRD